MTLLMIRRIDNGNWAVIGGAAGLGESVAQAAVRETLEETRIERAVTEIVGIYSDPRHVNLYTSNGETRQEFSIVLTARPCPGSSTRAASPARSAGFSHPMSPGTRWTPQCAAASATFWPATTHE